MIYEIFNLFDNLKNILAIRCVLVFIVLSINILCQQYDPQIQKHIKPDFYKLSELLTSNGGCKFLNKYSTSFTGDYSMTKE